MNAPAISLIRHLPASDVHAGGDAGAELRLGIKERAAHDIGAVIARPQDPALIAGVVIELGTIWPDDRGFFTELFRLGPAKSATGMTRDFGEDTQISAALSYAGAIKAVHFHRRQADVWAPVRGQFQMALFDLRLDSPTFGRVNTLYGGAWRPWRVRIPAGVGHGYKVLGESEGMLVYATNRHYDPTDEGRIAYNDPGLNYDWERQNK
ncbi:MAG: dTDP-4-dehydrorhamnose 3,5-epimerase family protein [Terriglobales bacterium]